MKKSLTKIQMKRYIENGGDNCPYCLSQDILLQISMANLMYCRDCQENWQNIYTLTGIKEL